MSYSNSDVCITLNIAKLTYYLHIESLFTYLTTKLMLTRCSVYEIVSRLCCNCFVINPYGVARHHNNVLLYMYKC